MERLSLHKDLQLYASSRLRLPAITDASGAICVKELDAPGAL